jgi:hypothetical protein
MSSDEEVKVSQPRLKQVPRSLVNFITRGERSWTTDGCGIYNSVPYDSRSHALIDIITKLCLSSLSDARIVVIIEHPVYVRNQVERAGNSVDGLVTATSFVKASALCSLVHHDDPNVTIMVMIPLKDAIPFVMDTLANPPEEAHEALLSKDDYVGTIHIGLHRFQLRVNIFRR